jgi:putative SOS response-associated peptidase YedK
VSATSAVVGRPDQARIWNRLHHSDKEPSPPNWVKNRFARAETVATAPAFREAFKARRCLVLTSGFYEWQPTAAQKQPYLIGMKDRSPFALAGVWESWKDRATGETIESFTVIVGPPNDLVRPIHDRMPLIIDPADYNRWLTAPEPPTDLLRPYPAELNSSPSARWSTVRTMKTRGASSRSLRNSDRIAVDLEFF